MPVHTSTFVHICTHLDTYAHNCLHMYKLAQLHYIYLHACTHEYICTHLYTPAYICITHMCTLLHTSASHSFIDTFTHLHISVHIPAHVCIKLHTASYNCTHMDTHFHTPAHICIPLHNLHTSSHTCTHLYTTAIHACDFTYLYIPVHIPA